MEYKEFLNKIGVISEEDYNEVISSFPKVNSDEVIISSFDDAETCDNLAEILIQTILNKYDWVYCEDVNFSNKEFSIYDVPSLSDLTNIKEEFSGWNICNYDEIKHQLEEEEEKDRKKTEKDKIIEQLENLDLETLREIYKTYI